MKNIRNWEEIGLKKQMVNKSLMFLVVKLWLRNPMCSEVWSNEKKFIKYARKQPKAENQKGIFKIDDGVSTMELSYLSWWNDIFYI